MSQPETGDPPAEPTPPSTRHRLPWRRRLTAAFAARTRTYRSRSFLWRLTTPLACLVAGLLFMTSFVSAGGNDLRAGRYDDLPGLAEAEADKVERLRKEQATLVEQIDDLTEDLGATDASTATQQAEELRGPAGLEAVNGPGLTITLSDAPEAVLETAETEVSDLVVHQQDIQAVVNALWAGGAEAMMIQGQRVVSTTGIRCVGNTVVLHDVPYAPPYVISAIGPIDQMLQGIEDSKYIGFYLEAVAAYQLGWELEFEEDLHIPAYQGSTELSHARPAEGVSTFPDAT
jgi:uncharacterized protein YlxW (UPF0749 family)